MCSPFPVEAAPRVSINGVFVQPDVVPHGHETEFYLSLPPFAQEHGARLSLDFFIDHATNIYGLGLCAFTLLGEPRETTALSVVAGAEDQGLAAAGFTLHPCLPGVGPPGAGPGEPEPRDVSAAELILQRSPGSILIVAPDALDAWRRLAPHLRGNLDTACVSIARRPPDPGSPILGQDGLQALHLDISEGAALPNSPTLLLDHVHFHGVQGQPGLADLLGWAVRHLSYKGVITGCEASPKAAEQTLAAMVDTSAGQRLMLTLCGPEWQAFPQTFFKP